MALEVLEGCFAISGRTSRAETRHPGDFNTIFREEGGFPCVRLILKVSSLRLVDSNLIEKLPAKEHGLSRSTETALSYGLCRAITMVCTGVYLLPRARSASTVI